MAGQGQRFENRLPDTDWVEVSSYTDGKTLTVGHLKDVGMGGLSLDLPLCLQPGTKVHATLSRMSPSGLIRHFQFTGTIVHAEAFGLGCIHGIKFGAMTEIERTALIDYLCQVEYRYRMAG